MDKNGIFTHCKNAQNAARKMCKISDESIRNEAAYRFIAVFIECISKNIGSPEFGMMVFSALKHKGSLGVLEAMTGVSLRQMMIEAKILPETAE